MSVYKKDKDVITTNDKFIYCVETYLLWKNGASLIDEKYYSVNKPLKLKKKDLLKKEKTYSLCRFVTLEFAPESWLKNEGYKLIK